MKRRAFHLHYATEESQTTIIDVDDDEIEINVTSSTAVIEEPREEEEEEDVPIKRRRIMVEEEDKPDLFEILDDCQHQLTHFTEMYDIEEPSSSSSSSLPHFLPIGKSRLGLFMEDFNNMFSDFNRLTRNMREMHRDLHLSSQQQQQSNNTRRIQIEDLE